MRVFGDDKYSGRRRDKYDRRDRRSDKPQMYDAVCDECGKPCKVPFKPSTDKPIYCSECFERKGGNTKSNSRGSSNNSRQLDEISEKLDRIIGILEEK